MVDGGWVDRWMGTMDAKGLARADRDAGALD